MGIVHGHHTVSFSPEHPPPPQKNTFGTICKYFEHLRILLTPFQKCVLIASDVSVAPTQPSFLNIFKTLTKFPQLFPLPYLRRTSISIYKNVYTRFSEPQGSQFDSLSLYARITLLHFSSSRLEVGQKG